MSLSEISLRGKREKSMLQTHGTYGQTLRLHTYLSKITACWHPQACQQSPLSTCSSRLSLPSIYCPAPAALSGTLSHPLAPLNHSANKSLSHSLMRRCRSLALSPAWKHGQGNARTKKGMCKVHFQQLVSNNNSNKLESFAKAVPWAPHLILCVHYLQMCADQSCQALTGTP